MKIITNRALVTCEIPRWQIIKSGLNNLNYINFTKSYQNDPEATLIDVRTIEEFNAGTLQDAINLDYLSSDLADQLESLDPSKSYYVFCRSGRRSLRICTILQNLGFRKVFNLEDGISSHLENI